MKQAALVALSAAFAMAISTTPQHARADSNSKHNGTCVGFAGSTAGKHNYAGIKCALDSAPDNWVIRYTVAERDKAEEYKVLARMPKRPVRCTLTYTSTTYGGGYETTNYSISNC